MNHYAQVSQPIKPQKRVGAPENTPNPDVVRRQAEYLASVNLSATPKWQYELKTLPRVTGRGTHVVITEYGLLRPTVEPHDVVLDTSGRVWYSDFGEMQLGSVDPKTGKVTEYPVKTLKPGYPVGMLDLERDHEGNFWLGVMFQGALAKFDRKTDKFQFWPLPKEANDDVAQINMVTTMSNVSGKVWTNNVGHGDIYRLDLKTGQYEHFMPYKDLPDEFTARPSPACDLRPRLGLARQSLLHGFCRAVDRSRRCADRQGFVLYDADRQFTPAPRPDGCAGPVLVRGIRRQSRRDARHQERLVPGMGDADGLDRAL